MGSGAGALGEHSVSSPALPGLSVARWPWGWGMFLAQGGEMLGTGQWE